MDDIDGRVDTVIGLVGDCETTGVGDDDVIIEFALRRFRADPDGVIVKIDRACSWLEDPGRDLPENIVRLTGITDADVAGSLRVADGAHGLFMQGIEDGSIPRNPKIPLNTQAGGFVDLMSPGSYQHLVDGINLAPASYGKAVERLTARYVQADPDPHRHAPRQADHRRRWRHHRSRHRR